MDGPIEWFGAIGASVVAGLIAADLGRRFTAWAFVLFLAVSLVWIDSGLHHDAWSLVAQNGLLLAINGWGVWQYLLSPRKKREIERQQHIAEQLRDELDRADPT
ncbi:hypothetical protein [Novosphingobium sp.]|uniref:hypothetical protein n=1 Tax=Novosphingobium sp. TaxID=1874826 RepID=UPI002622C340|nr:hypothetical protein [Novosphingobium sp.]